MTNNVFIERFSASNSNPSTPLRKHFAQGSDQVRQDDWMVMPAAGIASEPNGKVVFTIVAPSQAQLLPEFPCLSAQGAK